MPKLTVEGEGTFDVPAGKRLVLALEDDANIEQLHNCGGVGKCTTCRVKFIAGEPERMTQKELETLTDRELVGGHYRLSCQIPCEHDMHVIAESRLPGSGKKDVGPRPADAIEPEPVWIEKPATA